MNFQLVTQNYDSIPADWLVVGIPEADGFPATVSALDETLGGVISRVREAKDLTGKNAETVSLLDVANIAAKRVLLLGVGKPDEITRASLNKAVMTAARLISSKETATIAIALPDLSRDGCSHADQLETAVAALEIGCMGQGIYHREPKRFAFENVTVVIAPADDEAALQTAVDRGEIFGEAVNLTRDLVNRPAQDINPISFAAVADGLANQYGLGCEVFDEDRLREEKMEALLGVARGSDQPPRMVILKHNGGADGAPTLYLCGKGVTFDSGGLSLKPSGGMLDMKMDMAGAATVLGAMIAIARLEIPVNVVALMGLTENMVNGSSYKLGDVLTARNGVTIEVHNTDAEGRLVLADVLSYAVDQKADCIIDLATLTGACMVALGNDVVGAFSNNQQWCDTVVAASRDRGELLWQMPMYELYDELIKSDVADIKNVGGKWGGAITAAKFLEQFVGDTNWVHLDIAGPAFSDKNQPHQEGGATGVMVQTLVEVAGRFN